MRSKLKIILGIFIIGIIIVFFIFNGNTRKNSYSNNKYQGFIQQESGEQKMLDRSEAINYYWDEIRDYVNGTETINACSSESGNCYSLDTDISGGIIEEIYFDNGGYLCFSADIDEDGNASDIDQDGNSWDFTIDMNSSIIDDAIDNWAYDNDYIIE